ncbi:hypothetical protein [Pedobacter caeni]|uniref:Uncharacterized protein n=1 Tax=Pedobacter caeni TaxID=288992 RepID=A0A1M4WEU3_9SPHI|nr:hypothetical protein [Pedobacter caeni]SHE79811.1 hypothetical protein SAMN04488522_1011247 [Pedobacter caeni]
MTDIQLNNKLYSVEALSHITQQLIDWDFQPVTGIGLYTKIERYAHLEIKLYLSDSYDSRVIWNTDETYFPYDIRIGKAIEKYLLFFTNYLSALKGKSVQLIFEITDGTYHLVDSDDKTYGYAVLYALVDCFDKTYYKPDELKIARIAGIKAEARAFFKSQGTRFTVEELRRSLENIALTRSVKELIHDLSHEELSLYLETCDQYRLNLRIKPKLSEEKIAWFKAHKVIVGYNCTLSYIGLWHIAVASRNAYFFARYFGLYNDPELKKYMDMYKP